jgi:trimeric autotransporter adhesin
MANEFHVRNGIISHGDIDILDNKISTSVTNSDLTLESNGTGRIKLNNMRFPVSDSGQSGKVLSTNGSGDLSWITPSSGGGSGVSINSNGSTLGTASTLDFESINGVTFSTDTATIKLPKILAIRFTVNASNQISGYDASTVPAGVTVTAASTTLNITFPNTVGRPAMIATNGYNTTNSNWAIRHHGTFAFVYSIGATETTVTMTGYATTAVGSVSGASDPFWVIVYLI